MKNTCTEIVKIFSWLKLTPDKVVAIMVKIKIPNWKVLQKVQGKME